MRIVFKKYHGTGNDFIVIDNRILMWEPTRGQVSFLCDRHFGIGADGLMLLTWLADYDFGMVYYNSDGAESTMCGNGGRCMTAFAKSLNLVNEKAIFRAVDGVHEAILLSQNGQEASIRLKMKDTEIGQDEHDDIFIDTGSPHFVRFVDDVLQIDVCKTGRELRYDSRFGRAGTNVDFVQVTGQGLHVRTYERGVENETLSCGTGVTAAALAFNYKTQGISAPVMITTQGGDLKVCFERRGRVFTDIWLEGPARLVFEGSILLDESKDDNPVFINK